MKFCKMFEWAEAYEVIKKSRVTALTQKVLSQRELTRMALAQGAVWRIEKGFSEVHPQTIRKLARVLGVEPKELVKGEESR
jgi:transcriptional regulator with XRE-family HTH domain